MLTLVVGQIAQQLLGLGFVTDQVVVNKKHVAHAARAQLVELTADLLRCLGAGPATEHDDDVAELATVGATAGELQARRRVVLELQQIEPRWR